ncbi:molybdopterin molybdotransferase MoeA [Aeromicrobium senzhongii]|uniref:Molybdopterin molybdenumtransferase n=1 Tax=Aeromicrobium senzhongii TaxID=2663859 RepID=A0ABX6SVC4_9ACTN|nr:molybdopterin molybdotransferase MoeA [Aeromicrobium senzhongii]MTB87833.1 molybdopterin molybdenumtransferase MoeA [Aeromicrobium senzhongii]QNL95147.1 molybdopterin molybdotransferase MoeA [Aeromicrobium senzhongii]
MTDPSWAEARDLARAALPRGEIISVTLAGAVGTVATEDLRALGPIPHATTSAMDGWAVCGPAPWQLDPDDGPLSAGRARAVVTGAVPPDGTDAIVPSEAGRLSGDVLHGDPPVPGRHVRPAGEEAQEGDVLVSAGQVLTPARVGVLAMTGHDTIAVRRAPLVHLVVTGDELVPSGVPQAGHVRDALTPTLPPLLGALGGKVARLDHVRDDPRALAAKVVSGDADLVITAGGTGHSAADPIDAAWARSNADVRFRGVDMRPGHPVSLAVLPDGRPWLALPGNPLAATMTALSFVPALVEGFTGAVPAEPAWAVAGAAFESRADTTLVPARHTAAGVVPVGRSRPHLLTALADADVVVIVPRGGIGPGDPVQVLRRAW